MILHTSFWLFDVAKGGENRVRNQEINFIKFFFTLIKSGIISKRKGEYGSLVYTILISGVAIVKKGEIVEARLQEILMMPTIKCSSWIIQLTFKQFKKYKLHLQVRFTS